MNKLSGKVAVITGAGRKNGIGAAIARRLAQDGAHVVVTDLCAPPPADVPNPGVGQWEELQEVAAACTGMGVQALPLKVDVTQVESVQAMVAETMRVFGRLDILVNNAGVVFGPAPVVRMEVGAWERTFAVNATGTFLCCHAALPAMLQGNNGGRIVNMSSIAAIRPKPFLSSYAASKAAIIAFTQALAQEVATAGITVNAILPGDIETGFKQWGLQLESTIMGEDYEAVRQRAIAQIPVGRIGQPADVAAVVAFLCQDEADFLTGQAYGVTGGRELTAVVLPR
jgi:NAD(P)-dependent dehydrogenase (short-subunit alcohol dehydrogenase family)